MKRREFLRAIGLGFTVFALPGCAGATRSSETVRKKRPNFLFVMSDDHATKAIGCYSSRINKTPNVGAVSVMTVVTAFARTQTPCALFQQKQYKKNTRKCLTQLDNQLK